MFASWGRHSPAACLLYILLDSGLAAPCVSMHTTVLLRQRLFNVFLLVFAVEMNWTLALCLTSSHDCTASLF